MAEAKVIIKAEDRTQAAFRSVQNNLQKLAGVLGVGLGAGYFVSLVKSSIDAADRLHDLSKTTGITVEDLAGLNLLAKQTGTDLDGLAKGINKMSVAIGKDPDKFRALGVTAKDNVEAFKQLADIFNLLPDIQQRNALAQSVFSKSWTEMAPALSEGGKKIGEVVEEGKKLSKMTESMGVNADKFNDDLAKLNITLGATKTKLVADMLPGMNDIAKAMQEAAKEGGLLLTVWVGLGGVMANLLGMSDAQKSSARIREINDELAVMTKQLAAGSLNPPGANNSLFSFLIPNVKLGQDALAKIRASIDALEEEKKRLTPPGVVIKPPPDPLAAAAAAAKAKLFLGVESEKQLENLLDDLRKATLENQAAITEDEKEKAQLRVDAAKQEMEKKLKILERTGISRKAVESDYNKWLASEQAKANYTSRTEMEKLNDEWQNSTKQMQLATAGWAKSSTDAIVEWGMTGKNTVRDFVNSALRDLLRLATQKNITGPLFSSMESGGFFQAIGSMMGFAHGGSFNVGGSGGTDSQLVQFMATPGERVSVETPGQQAGGANVTVNVINQSGTPVQADNRGGRFDGETYIVDVVLRNIDNYGPLRTAIAGV